LGAQQTKVWKKKNNYGLPEEKAKNESSRRTRELKGKRSSSTDKYLLKRREKPPTPKKKGREKVKRGEDANSSARSPGTLLKQKSKDQHDCIETRNKKRA